MATTYKFNCFVADLANGKHNLGSDTLKIMLSNTLPLVTNTVTANISEIAAGNGYSAGGVTATLISSSQTSGTYTLKLNNPNLVASGGPIGPFQYAILRNATYSGGPLILFSDYGSAITLNAGDDLTLDVGGSSGLFTVI